MVRNVFCSNGFCKAGCSAMHLTVAPLSDLLTGNNNLEMDVQVRVLWAGELTYPLGNVDGLMSSWVCPVWISWFPAYQLNFAGGFPPVVIHSSSKSSPAEATTSWRPFSVDVAPTFWMTIVSGFSVNSLIWASYIKIYVQSKVFFCEYCAINNVLMLFTSYN